MTYNELRAQVASLGFERTVSDDDALLRAVERALSILHLDVAEIRKKRIFVRAPRLTKVYKSILHRGGGEERLELSGTAFSFRPHGDGEFLLSTENDTTRVKFYADGGIVKGSISGRATITFTGAYDYVITSLASFDGGFDLSLSGVPEYSEEREIDLAVEIGDFGGLSAMPRCVSANMTEPSITARGRSLYLPFSFEGEVEISYRRVPRRPIKSGEPLDLPAGSEQLFPFLVASFVWLDDDEEKAQYYMALYRDGIAKLSMLAPSQRTTEYKTNGWA